MDGTGQVPARFDRWPAQNKIANAVNHTSAQPNLFIGDDFCNYLAPSKLSVISFVIADRACPGLDPGIRNP